MAAAEVKEKVNTKIIIIGAGIAGLSAASHLMKNGEVNFQVIEARERLGGRVSEVSIGCEKIELGSNWIHGVLGNPLYELAAANGLIDIIQQPKERNILACMENGEKVPFAVLQEVYEAYFCFLRRCEEYFLCKFTPPDGISSVGEHIQLEVDIYLDSLPLETQYVRQLIFSYLLKREACISGCDTMNEIDLLEMGSFSELPGGNISLPKGFTAMLETLTRHIPKDKIITNCPVVAIHWKQCDCAKRERDSGFGDDLSTEESANSTAKDGVDSDDSDKTVTEDVSECKCQSKSKDRVKVICQGGQTFMCRNVICTLPLGVLRECGSELFKPSLPEDKLEAVKKLLYGTVDKIFLEYERPFLPVGISEVVLLWDDLENLPNVSMSDKWFRKIYSFIKLSDTLLLAWISGKEAEFMETLNFDQVSSQCTDILRLFLSDALVPKPRQCICTRWKQDPYSNGSYTALAVGSGQLDILSIARPVYAYQQQEKPSLLFAGEHTHPSYYSTAHGAFLSGRTAAQIILKQDSPKTCQQQTITGNESLSSWVQGISLE